VNGRVTALGSHLTALIDGSGHRYVNYVDTNGQIWENYWSGTGWSNAQIVQKSGGRRDWGEPYRAFRRIGTSTCVLGRCRRPHLGDLLQRIGLEQRPDIHMVRTANGPCTAR
jgi:hypothetical protein